jgi:hypothetical protein
MILGSKSAALRLADAAEQTHRRAGWNFTKMHKRIDVPGTSEPKEPRRRLQPGTFPAAG